MLASDPYLTARQGRRFGMPYGLSQSTNYPRGGAVVSPYSAMRQPIQRPETEGARGSANPGEAQAEALRRQMQQSQAERAGVLQAQTQEGLADQAASIADYRQKRDTSPGAIAAREQTQEATALGIDPSSSPADIAKAASGQYRTGPDGRIAGGDTGNGTVSPGQPNDVRNAILQMQAQKDGAQRTAVDQSYAKGAGVISPFTPANPPQPSTTSPMALRDGTNATQPPPVPAPPVAPMAPTPFAPFGKPKKPRNGYAGGDGSDPNAVA